MRSSESRGRMSARERALRGPPGERAVETSIVGSSAPSDGRESGSRKHGGFAALLLLPLETALISSFLRTTTGDSEGKGNHGRQGVFGLDRFAVQRPARALQAPADDRQGSLGPGLSGGTHLPQ